MAKCILSLSRFFSKTDSQSIKKHPDDVALSEQLYKLESRVRFLETRVDRFVHLLIKPIGNQATYNKTE